MIFKTDLWHTSFKIKEKTVTADTSEIWVETKIRQNQEDGSMTPITIRSTFSDKTDYKNPVGVKQILTVVWALENLMFLI